MAVGTLKSNAMGFEAWVGPGHSAKALEGYEKASQSFKRGAVIIRDSGTVAIAAADATADILGVALSPASGTTHGKIPYIPGWGGTTFVATFEDQSNEDHALVVTNLYVNYAVQVDSSGNFYIDENDTTNDSVMIVGANKSDIDNAKVRARVLCVFLTDVLAQDT